MSDTETRDQSAPAVRLDGVTVRYERGAEPAIADVSFDLSHGAGLLICGPPGSGTSSLLRALLGLVPSSGLIEVLGRPAGEREALRHIGWAPARWPVSDGLTARGVVALVASLRCLKSPGEIADDLLARVGLADDRRKADRLEIEDARRLSLACALAGDPDLLILDDPWEFPETVAEITAALRRGASVLAASHDPGGLPALLGRTLPIGDEVGA